MAKDDYVLIWQCIAPECTVEIVGDSQRNLDARIVKHVTRHEPTSMREKTNGERTAETGHLLAEAGRYWSMRGKTNSEKEPTKCTRFGAVGGTCYKDRRGNVRPFVKGRTPCEVCKEERDGIGRRNGL